MKINGKPDGSGGGVINSLSVTSNGIYMPVAGVDGFAPVDVNVVPTLESLSVSINGTYTPASGVDGYSQVTVSVPQNVGYTLNQIIDGNLPGATSINSTVQYFMTGGCWPTVETVNLPNAQYITAWAFAAQLGEMALTYVSAPSVLQIDEGCFMGCTNLTEVYAPNVQSVMQQTFVNCQNLTSVNITSCSSIGYRGFGACIRLSQISLPNVTYVGQQAFVQCYSLNSLDLPSCTTIESQAFYRCSSMTQASLPEVLSIGDQAFQQAGLTTISLPKCNRVGYAAFAYCRSLSQAYLPRVDYFAPQVFTNCNNLTELTIGTDWYFIPQYNNQLNSTGIARGNGSIYVDAAMYDKWVVSQGWSQFAARFVSVGDATIPMLSLSDGLLYGKTKVMGNVQQAGYMSNQITAVNLSSCDTVLSNAFQYCQNLSSVDLPLCTSLGEYAFYNDTSITYLSLPACKYVDFAALAVMPLASISLPACEYLGDSAFEGCYFTEIYLGPCSVIGDYCIRQMLNLSKLTINYSGVCYFNTQRNNLLPITSVYVPAELVSAYKEDNYWSVYASQIFPIE